MFLQFQGEGADSLALPHQTLIEVGDQALLFESRVEIIYYDLYQSNAHLIISLSGFSRSSVLSIEVEWGSMQRKAGLK